MRRSDANERHNVASLGPNAVELEGIQAGFKSFQLELLLVTQNYIPFAPAGFTLNTHGASHTVQNPARATSSPLEFSHSEQVYGRKVGKKDEIGRVQWCSRILSIPTNSRTLGHHCPVFFSPLSSRGLPLFAEKYPVTENLRQIFQSRTGGWTRGSNFGRG